MLQPLQRFPPGAGSVDIREQPWPSRENWAVQRLQGFQSAQSTLPEGTQYGPDMAKPVEHRCDCKGDLGAGCD